MDSFALAEMLSRPVRILVVDDDESVVNVITSALEGAKYDVDFALSGIDAIALASSKQYDAILLDLVMPEMDGVGVLKQIKNSDKTCGNKSTPVVVITGYAGGDLAHAAQELGVMTILQKPFNMATVLQEISNAIRHARLFRR